jgi:hypothetical protein
MTTYNELIEILVTSWIMTAEVINLKTSECNFEV